LEGGILRAIGAFEAKNTLGSLLDLVEQGEEVVITRRGRPVARLVRETLAVDRTAAKQAAADILAASKGVTLGGLRLRDLIDEGRP
jgi:antitoxin (DNA-binding transcriptional repressor) of toxin-antitoxin stability system